MLTPFGQALAALLLLVNAAGFLAFGWDKWRAKRSAYRHRDFVRRSSESRTNVPPTSPSSTA